MLENQSQVGCLCINKGGGSLIPRGPSLRPWTMLTFSGTLTFPSEGGICPGLVLPSTPPPPTPLLTLIPGTFPGKFPGPAIERQETSRDAGARDTLQSCAWLKGGGDIGGFTLWISGFSPSQARDASTPLAPMALSTSLSFMAPELYICMVGGCWTGSGYQFMQSTHGSRERHLTVRLQVPASFLLRALGTFPARPPSCTTESTRPVPS